MPGDAEMEHQESQHRFVLAVDRQEAELTYRLSGETIVFDHTEVPAALQHRGFADKLAVAALRYAREQNLRVDPQCRFMAVYIQRHEQYQDLLLTPTESRTPRPLAGGAR